MFQFIWICSLYECFFINRNASGFIAEGSGEITWKGTLWGMFSAITYTTFIFLISRVEKAIPVVQKSSLFTTGDMITVFLLSPPTDLLQLPVLLEIAPYGFYLGLLGVVLPPILFTIGMPHIGPGLGTILTSAELPIAVILSALVLTEQVSLSQWLGVVLILGGIIAGNLKIAKTKIKPAYLEKESTF